MDRYTELALSFIQSRSVRATLENAGHTFSASDALTVIFQSRKPQTERFCAMLEILSEMGTDEAKHLSDRIRQIEELTSPKKSPHYLFRERYETNPRSFLTIEQMKRWLNRRDKNEDKHLCVDVFSHGKRVFEELCLSRYGVYDIRCFGEERKLLNSFTLPKVSFFKAGEIVRCIEDGTKWVVICADFTTTPVSDLYWDYIDFSAMVIPYEYREYATPELIRKHYSETAPSTVDIISEMHEHIYLPILETDTQG